MKWHLLALTGLTAFVGIGFGWRSWWHYRRYGNSGFALFRSGRAGQNVRDALLLVVGVLLAGQAMAAVVDSRWIAAIGTVYDPGRLSRSFGAVLLFASTPLLVKAQLDLGASWRIGVVEGERPGLVATGIYARSRNPIYVAVLVMLSGYTLLLPSWLSLVTLVGAFVGFRKQAVAEEEHLLRTYGEEYRAYASRVGRFLPGIGRLR